MDTADDDVLRWNETRPVAFDVAVSNGSAQVDSMPARVYSGDLLEDTYDDWVVSYRDVWAMCAPRTSAASSCDRDARDFKSCRYAARCCRRSAGEDVLRQLMACRCNRAIAPARLRNHERFVRQPRATRGADAGDFGRAGCVVRSSPLRIAQTRSGGRGSG